MTKQTLVSTLLLAAACQPAPLPIETELPVVQTLPSGAQPALAAIEPVRFSTNSDGFFPLRLKQPVSLTLPANARAELAVGVPASAELIWAAVRTEAPARLTSGSVSFTTSGDASSWVQLPVRHGKVELTASIDVAMTLRPVGYFDQSGAGLAVNAEPVASLDVTAGEAVLVIPALGGPALDDTWATLLRVEATAGAAALTVDLRGCEHADPLDRLTVAPGETRSVVLLSPRGALCSVSTEATTLKVQPLARFRRFQKSSWRGAEPLVVLDTQAGVRWSGEPLAGQRLEVDLSGLSGLQGASLVALHLTGGDFSAGPCAGTLSRFTGGGSLVHDPALPFCVETHDTAHVRVALAGAALGGDPAPQVCPTLPAAVPCTATDLLGKLNCIPGVTAYSDPGEPDRYWLQVTQPVDHARPDGASFKQQVLLTYQGSGAPVVMHTTGYELFTYRSDLGTHLSATELEVEHRFFGTSTPLGRDFSTLDIVQSAQDSHRIVELLRPVLKGRWLSTGHSKGGMTAVFHRRFFPCDVDGTVPYVAPISFALSDPRYGQFLQTVGGATLADCTQLFRDIDRDIIGNKATYASRLRGGYTKVGGRENALWNSVGLTAWPLFQYEDALDPDRGCPAYVDAGSTPGGITQLADYFAGYGEAYADEVLEQYEHDDYFGYTYQTTNELGGQGATFDHLLDLGPVPQLLPTGPLSLGTVAVPGYEPRAMRDVQDWVSAHGTRFLFIYGEFDPWTAGAYALGDATDSLKFVAPGLNHGVRFSDLKAADRLAADATLRRWVSAAGPSGGQRSRARVQLDARPEFRDVMKAFRL